MRVGLLLKRLSVTSYNWCAGYVVFLVSNHPVGVYLPVGDEALPSSTYVRTWRSDEGGQVSDNLGHAFLLLGDMEHYASCQDDDLVLKLKWHIIAVTFSSLESVTI